MRAVRAPEFEGAEIFKHGLQIKRVRLWPAAEGLFRRNGYFDLAAPVCNTEYDRHHRRLAPAIASSIKFGYYPAGHVVYLKVEALKMLEGDMGRFHTEATRR